MMGKSVEQFNGYSLIDEKGASSFAVESLFGILAELNDNDLSGYIERLAGLAQRDFHGKIDSIVSIIEEFIGEIEIGNGLCGGNSMDAVKRIRFRPCVKLIAAIRGSFSENPDFTIEIPGGWKMYQDKKKGASSLGGNDIEAPSAKSPVRPDAQDNVSE